ncbi:FMN-binding protein [Actinomyces viscosus]|uniref:FMN-binding protein n=1 Tax=Actinomyces viscosus TaxID=1656 RepID=UPI000F82820C|nr:FMN-binding protein [Actinomyces viscosus]TFH53532.1 FMN-binding protein [Actinomyces viscosus]
MSPQTPSRPRHHDGGGRAGSRALAVAGVLLASTGPLTGCGGGDVTPSQGDYAGREQTANPTAGPSSRSTGPASAPVASPTAGPYADGTFSASEAYGPVDDLIEDDSLDVSLTLSGGVITGVTVTGHASTDTSKEHIQNFVDAINGAVVGHSIEDAHVQALAGASKTSNAFNDAVDAIAEQSRASATQPVS